MFFVEDFAKNVTKFEQLTKKNFTYTAKFITQIIHNALYYFDCILCKSGSIICSQNSKF